ncbi:uncharacterized protein BJ212DRAFT_1582455 [Suillus subaureus]|uniref:Uncharacterized protein n=1 Tax=Suillus subaureus TaxID=48587 RepID=A0A9P7DJN5_9AGAM|nr:uncharacterized protein BJ212DRAFT_1582455 [Suillus subaureus]KAG1795876.1 hypothetical protein BJ212DRAFT_1582455 [Suillus subaureus]
MKLSLVFSVLASIVVLATAYPTQGTVAKRSYVEKREELDANDFNYVGVEKRDEIDASDFLYPLGEEKREEIDASDFLYPLGEEKHGNSMLISD